MDEDKFNSILKAAMPIEEKRKLVLELLEKSDKENGLDNKEYRRLSTLLGKSLEDVEKAWSSLHYIWDWLNGVHVRRSPQALEVIKKQQDEFLIQPKCLKCQGKVSRTPHGWQCANWKCGAFYGSPPNQKENNRGLRFEC